MLQYLADDEGKAARTKAEWRVDGYTPRRGARPFIRRVVVRVREPIWGKRIRLVDAPKDIWEVEDEIVVYLPDQVVPVSQADAPPVPSASRSSAGNAPSGSSASSSSAGHAPSVSSADDDGVEVLVDRSLPSLNPVTTPIRSTISPPPLLPYVGKNHSIFGDRPHPSPSRRTGCKVNDRRARAPRQYVPEGFGWEAVPKAIREGVKWFFSTLYLTRLQNRRTRTEYNNLLKVHMEAVLTNWRHVRRWCLEQGHVECDGVYAKGSKAFGYRFGANLRERTFRLVPVTDRGIQRRVKARKITKPLYQWLEDNLRRMTAEVPDRLSDDDRQALQLVNDGGMVYNAEDESGGRFHSNLTNMRSDLRQHLRVDGKRLVQIDLKNSQPMSLVVRLDKAGVECGRYRQVCEEGNLYELLATKSGLTKEKTMAEARAEAKAELIQRVFFGRLGARSKVGSAFKREFGAAWNYVQEVKGRDHAELACLLQRTESDLVIRTVCEALRREHPGMFVATIHDSIVCLPDDAEKVICSMRQAFARVNLNPRLEVQPL